MARFQTPVLSGYVVTIQAIYYIMKYEGSKTNS